jgi:hypothetical protein
VTWESVICSDKYTSKPLIFEGFFTFVADPLPSYIHMKFFSSLFLVFFLFLSGKAQSSVMDPGDSLIDVKGGRIRLSPLGFPEQILLSPGQDSLLAENIHFHFTRQSDGKDIRLKTGGIQFVKRASKIQEWKVSAGSDELQVEISASLDNGGMLTYAVKVTALADLDLTDITMHIPFRKEMAGYMNGLGMKYGPRTDSLFLWKWGGGNKDPGKVWIGTPASGLQYILAGGSGWTNEGKGGIGIGIKGKSMLANNYTGPRHLPKGDMLLYNFSLLIIPGG